MKSFPASPISTSAEPVSGYDTPPPAGSPKDKRQLLEKTLIPVAGHEKRKRDWSELFAGNICFGENHSDLTTKKFLVQNMKHMKGQGFDAIFMEHLSGQEHQEFLNRYFQSGVMDKILERKLESLNENHLSLTGHAADKSLYNFKTVVTAAREAGIPIIALEISMSDSKQNNQGRERMISLNANAKKVIEEEEKNFLEKNGRKMKWSAFVGNAHVNKYYGVPGIADVLDDVQDVIMFDNEGGLEESVRITKDKSHPFPPKAPKEPNHQFAAIPGWEEIETLENGFLPEFSTSICLTINVENDLTYNPQDPRGKIPEVSSKIIRPRAVKRVAETVLEGDGKRLRE